MSTQRYIYHFFNDSNNCDNSDILIDIKYDMEGEIEYGYLTKISNMAKFDGRIEQLIDILGKNTLVFIRFGIGENSLEFYKRYKTVNIINLINFSNDLYKNHDKLAFFRFTFFIKTDDKQKIINDYFEPFSFITKPNFDLADLNKFGSYPGTDEEGTSDMNIFNLDLDKTLIITLEHSIKCNKWMCYYSRLNNNPNMFKKTLSCIKESTNKYYKAF